MEIIPKYEMLRYINDLIQKSNDYLEFNKFNTIKPDVAKNLKIQQAIKKMIEAS